MDEPASYFRLFYTVNALHQALFRASDNVLSRKAGISSSQSAVLLYLSTQDNVSIGDAAAAVGVKITSMSGLVDRMETKGLLARTRCAVDARTVQLELTPAGLAIAKEVKPLIKDANARLLAAAGDAEELAVFATVCARLTASATNDEIYDKS